MIKNKENTQKIDRELNLSYGSKSIVLEFFLIIGFRGFED